MEAEAKLPAAQQAAALLVDAKEAARMLAMSTRKLWELTNRGEIPSLHVGRSVRYRVAALEAWTQALEKGRGPRVAGAARASARPAGVHSSGGEA